MTPLVSVLIPTYRRPDLVERAARSALEQTLREIEVIVVVDSRDYATVRALYGIGDRRLRVIMPAHHLGKAGARNAGLATAHGTFVALLNDDDMWLPEKLERQVASAQQSALAQPIITCRVATGHTRFSAVRPRRLPRADEPLTEYLFCRSNPVASEGLVQASTVLARRTLFQRVPFASGRRYVDLDWLLRASAEPGVGVEFVPERAPLVVWNRDPARERIRNAAEGEYALRWAREHRHLLTRRAYAGFLLTRVSMSAARGSEWNLFMPLLREARGAGDPSLIDVVAHLQYFIVPDELRRLKGIAVSHFRSMASRWRRPVSMPQPMELGGARMNQR